MERRLAAILAADVVGYSRMMAANEEGTFQRLTQLRRGLMEPLIAQHNGRVVKLVGDGLLAEFPSVVDAVECAIQIQASIATRNSQTPSNERINLRIGVNMGDVIVEGDDIYGDGVNIAARLEPLAPPGGICISREAYENTRGKVTRAFRPAGRQRLKNMPDPVMIYQAVDQKNQVAKSVLLGLKPRWAIPAAGVLVAAAGLIVWHETRLTNHASLPTSDSVEAGERPSLVVLPFSEVGDRSEDSYVADGLTDDLITDLSNISGMQVIARNTAFSYKDRSSDAEAARELGVRYALAGEVRLTGDRIRIDARLLDSRTGENLWAKSIDRTASELFVAQDEVVQQIVSSLALQLSPFERQRLARMPTRNLEAYDYYLRAEEATRSGFRPRIREALRLYEKATSLDPTFARAYAAQARTEAFVMRQNYDDILAFPIARKLAYEHAGRALTIDPEAALRFAVLSELQTVDGRHEEALESARQAIAKAPGEADAYLALSYAETFAGKHSEAISAFETALSLNPRLPTGPRLVAAMSYILNDQAERAVEVLESVRAESAEVDDYQAILAAAYAEAGQMDLARVAAQEEARVGPNLCVELVRVNYAHFRRQEDLEAILDAMTLSGVQKWPFGFEPGERRALDEDEIRKISMGRSWRGDLDGVGPGVLQITDQGVLAIRTANLFATGSAQIAEDRLCVKYESLSLARPICGPIYAAAKSSGNSAYEYTYVNGNMVFNFTPFE